MSDNREAAMPTLAEVQGLDVLDPVEAAVFLRLRAASPRMASRAMRRLRVKKVRLGHRTVRYLRSDLLDYLEHHAA